VIAAGATTRGAQPASGCTGDDQPGFWTALIASSAGSSGADRDGSNLVHALGGMAVRAG